MSLTIAIRGLSLVVYRPGNPDCYEVLMNHESEMASAPGAHSHGPRHKGTLTILTKYLRPDHLDKFHWHPDHLGYVPVVDDQGITALEQVGIWELHNVKLTIGRRTGLKPWPERKDETIAFDHADLHGEYCTIRPPGPHCSVLRITDGKPSAFEPTKEIELSNNANSKAALKRIGFEVRFTDVSPVITDGTRKIPFNQNLTDFFVVVANLVPEPSHVEARKHFAGYYDSIADQDAIPYDEKVRFAIFDQADEVYDCVPPTTGS